MKKQITRKLHLNRETLALVAEGVEVRGGASENRLCATYTEIIGPCIDTNRC